MKNRAIGLAVVLGALGVLALWRLSVESEGPVDGSDSSSPGARSASPDAQMGSGVTGFAPSDPGVDEHTRVAVDGGEAMEPTAESSEAEEDLSLREHFARLYAGLGEEALRSEYENVNREYRDTWRRILADMDSAFVSTEAVAVPRGQPILYALRSYSEHSARAGEQDILVVPESLYPELYTLRRASQWLGEQVRGVDATERRLSYLAREMVKQGLEMDAFTVYRGPSFLED